MDTLSIVFIPAEVIR